jgi:hypothetical protein
MKQKPRTRKALARLKRKSKPKAKKPSFMFTPNIEINEARDVARRAALVVLRDPNITTEEEVTSVIEKACLKYHELISGNPVTKKQEQDARGT